MPGDGADDVQMRTPALRFLGARHVGRADRAGIPVAQHLQGGARETHGISVPLGVRRVVHEVPAVVAGTVAPPHRTSFAERTFGSIDTGTRLANGLTVPGVPGAPDLAPRGHQRVRRLRAILCGECEVGRAPQLPGTIR